MEIKLKKSSSQELEVLIPLSKKNSIAVICQGGVKSIPAQNLKSTIEALNSCFKEKTKPNIFVLDIETLPQAYAQGLSVIPTFAGFNQKGSFLGPDFIIEGTLNPQGGDYVD